MARKPLKAELGGGAALKQYFPISEIGFYTSGPGPGMRGHDIGEGLHQPEEQKSLHWLLEVALAKS